MSEKLLSIKELAAQLGRERHYVGAMVAQGFPMPGGRATRSEALAWLALNPKPRSSANTRRRAPSTELPGKQIRRRVVACQ